MSDEDIDAVVDNTSFLTGGLFIGQLSFDRPFGIAPDREDQLNRLTLGTDTPGGTGVIPRGMLRNVLYFRVNVQSQLPVRRGGRPSTG